MRVGERLYIQLLVLHYLSILKHLQNLRTQSCASVYILMFEIFIVWQHILLCCLFSCPQPYSFLYQFRAWSLKSKVHTKVYNGLRALSTSFLLFLFAHCVQILQAFSLSLHLHVAASFNFIPFSAQLLAFQRCDPDHIVYDSLVISLHSPRRQNMLYFLDAVSSTLACTLHQAGSELFLSNYHCMPHT